MLTYTLEGNKKESLYVQLYNALKDDIQRGVLQADSRLPSKRALAAHLGVSVMTVETAYETLLSEGYIYSVNRTGFFVTPLVFAERRKSAAQGQFAKKNTASGKISIQPEWRVDLASGRMSEALFPFSVWARIMRKTLSERKTELMKPSPAGGCTELKTAIALQLEQFRALHVLPEQIVLGAGTEYLYTVLLQLLGNDKTYALEDPGYTKIARIYSSFGAPVSFIPLDGDGMNMAALTASGAQVAHVMPSHQFPTGIGMSARRRYELLAWASEDEGRYIIEDDYDSEFRLHGKPCAPLKGMDGTEQVIYMNSFTKTLASTMRISYMVLPLSLLEAFEKRVGFYASTVSNFEQYTLSGFISGGFFERHISRLRTHYRAVRDALLLELEKSALFPYIFVSQKDTGLHFLLHIKNEAFPEVTRETIRARATAAGLKISFLEDYRTLPCREDACSRTLIIQYTSLGMQDIPVAVALLERALIPS